MKKISILPFVILAIFSLSDFASAQNAYELKKGEFYRTFEKKKKVTASSRLVHAPLMFDKEMSEEFFYQGRETILRPLMDAMNQYLDSLAWSQPMASSIPQKGLPWLFVGSSEAGTTVDDNAIRKLFTEERREDLPGQPLTWKIAVENLVVQLARKTRLS